MRMPILADRKPESFLACSLLELVIADPVATWLPGSLVGFVIEHGGRETDPLRMECAIVRHPMVMGEGVTAIRA